MKAIFVLLSVLATILFAAAATVQQTGNVLTISNLKGRPGQTAKMQFKDAASAAKNAQSIRDAFNKRGL